MCNARNRLRSVPSHIIGSYQTLRNFCNGIDSFSDDPYPKIFARMFETPEDWIRFDDTADPGIVLLVGTEGDVVYIDTR